MRKIADDDLFPGQREHQRSQRRTFVPLIYAVRRPHGRGGFDVDYAR